MLHYVIFENGYKKQLQARFWNCNGKKISVVASITKGADWAAYIGADTLETEEESMQHALDYGCKLGERDALHFFPELAEMRYRN